MGELRHEFWREKATGEVWAVELVGGTVVRCAGPIHWSAINPFYLHGYDYSAAEAARLEQTRDTFEPVDTAHTLVE
jgi:hypothetical protein